MLNIVNNHFFQSTSLFYKKRPFELEKKYKRITIPYFRLTLIASVDVNEIIYVLLRESFYQYNI